MSRIVDVARQGFIIAKIHNKFLHGFLIMFSVVFSLTVMIFFSIFLISVFNPSKISDEELNARLRLHNDVNEQMGFEYATPYKNYREIFVFSEVTPRKPMAESGIKKGDEILSLNVVDFYRLIVLNQGREISVSIRRENKKMQIAVKVPLLNLKYDPKS